MSLLDLLSSITGAMSPSTQVSQADVQGPNRTQAPDPVQMNGPPSDTQMAPPMGTVNMDPKPNYDNSDQVRAAHAANDQNANMGGGGNPGLYGLLPQSMQHGVLRNVLGALGDAFLVQGGGKPSYANSQDRQSLGDAMVGMNMDDPDSVQAATNRMAATGAPGSADMTDKVNQQATQAGLKRAQLEYTSDYHQQVIANARAGRYNAMAPKIQGMFTGVTDPDVYARKWATATQIAKQIDPDTDAEKAFGLVPPDEWQPGMDSGFGVTSGQQLVSADKGLQRENARRDTDVSAAARLRAAGIYAGRPTPEADIQADQNTLDAGGTLSPARQARWDRATALPRGTRRPPPINGGGSGGGSGDAGTDAGAMGARMAGHSQRLTPAQAMRLRPGTPFTGTDGRQYIR